MTVFMSHDYKMARIDGSGVKMVSPSTLPPMGAFNGVFGSMLLRLTHARTLSYKYNNKTNVLYGNW